VARDREPDLGRWPNRGTTIAPPIAPPIAIDMGDLSPWHIGAAGRAWSASPRSRVRRGCWPNRPATIAPPIAIDLGDVSP
jgi:hypothetical protein